LGETPVIVGRDRTCDLVILDTWASRRHAQVSAVPGGGFEVADLGSANGTQVNGVPITGATVLCDGDDITCGHTLIRYHE
jgi:pSer/pThr/pTyr-binding forkhead associated (FHA) protein